MLTDRDFLLKLAQGDIRDLIPGEAENLSLLNREQVKRPLVMVNSSTSGIVAGANETWEAIEQYVSDRSLEIELCETGSIGLSSEEPVISIQMPGKTRVFFSRVTSDRVVSLLDDLFHQVIPEQNLIGQMRREGQEPWADVPFLDEIPFFALQQRVVMEACGIIDPFSFAEYAARGGYSAFLKTIRSYTFTEVCDLVAESGLRGRSGGGFPTARKWKVAFQTPSDQKYLICNAEESDPGAFMDRTLMEGKSFPVAGGHLHCCLCHRFKQGLYIHP